MNEEPVKNQKKLENEKKQTETKKHKLGPPKRAQFALLATAMVISVCGISYELLAATVSSYFLGNAVLQYSLTIGIFLFAMGIGSFLSRKFEGNLLRSFIIIEIAIGLVGGFATFILFAAYRYTDTFSPVMYSLLLILGILIGLEVPLLIRILRLHEELKFSVSDILSFDYVGALLASILFPLVILPYMGIMHASFFYALINMVIVFFNLSVFKDYLKDVKIFNAAAGVVTIILLAGLFLSTRFVSFFEGKLYEDEVILTIQTRYQRIVMTRFKEDTRLFLDGNLQFSSWDEYRYHECLVHPAMSLAANREEVLILGGGDGLAAREVLKYPDVKRITLVDIDPKMVELCRKDPIISKLNQSSLNDPRMNVVIEDAYSYVSKIPKRFGVIIVDLPDPNNESLSKLYTNSFYKLLAQHLGMGGTICVQSTSPYFARKTFWCIFHTIQSSDLYAKPMHAYVPSMGDWGFTLASNVKIHPDRIKISVPTRFLKEGNVDPLFYFGKDVSEVETEINYLNSHKLLRYYEHEWRMWD